MDLIKIGFYDRRILCEARKHVSNHLKASRASKIFGVEWCPHTLFSKLGYGEKQIGG
jgi:hypothetical protein